MLGFWTAASLRGIYGPPTVVMPSEEGHEFLVAVVSVPKRLLIPSEERYGRMAEEAKKPGSDPLPKRECINLYDSVRFRLLLPSGGTGNGAFVCEWPPSVVAGFTRSIHMESTSRIPGHERVALAIAWAVDPKAVAWPMQVGFDADEPVPVPQVRLLPDPRLAPLPADLVNERVNRALGLVRTEKYGDAVAEAGAAARDKDAPAVAIYNAACVHALAVAMARQDAALPAAERKERAERLAASAVELLRQAGAKGFRDVSHIKVDTDLDSLRQREDFAKLLRELGVAAPGG